MVLDSAKPTVLVLDDDHAVLTALSRTLGCAFEVRVASDVRTALKVLDNHTIELIVCDYDLGETTGARFLAFVRGRYPAVRRVLCSALPPLRCDDAELVVEKPWPRALACMLVALVDK